MKTMNTTITSIASSKIRFLIATSIIAVMLPLMSSEAQATVVQTTFRILNHGEADFGSGNHAGGGPQSSATITYDWDTLNGQLRITGRVKGTLYWDSAAGSGCARLQIRFRNAANENLDFREIDKCGPGGNANLSQNKIDVDVSFPSISLERIVLTVANITSGAPPQSITINQVTQKSFPLNIENDKADFGDGGHHFGHPDNPGFVTFRRNSDATVTGGVDGILYWDAFDDDSCARMITEHLDGSTVPTILRTRTRDNCGPGGDANNPANQRFISEPFTSGSLEQIRIQVLDTADPVHGVLKLYHFNGFTGHFEVEPTNAIAPVNTPINYAFIWTVPEPLNWHHLDLLELRIMDGSNAILHVRFDEARNLISVFNQGTDQFGHGFPAGINKKLQTRYATLDLGETTVGPINSALGEGPNSPTVRLNLALRFKPSAAGKTYRVEVAASDDLGNQDEFALAGTLTVPE